MTRRQKKEGIKEGSRNVFADIGLKPEMLVKAELTRQLEKRIKALGLTQSEAANILGIKQPDVSKLMHGSFTGFSVDRLLCLLNALSIDVRIQLRPRALEVKGTMSVSAH